MNEELKICHGVSRGTAQEPATAGEAFRPRSLAMVYPVRQAFRDLFAPGEALCRGTLFRALNKPFLPGGRTL